MAIMYQVSTICSIYYFMHFRCLQQTSECSFHFFNFTWVYVMCHIKMGFFFSFANYLYNFKLEVIVLVLLSFSIAGRPYSIIFRLFFNTLLCDRRAHSFVFNFILSFFILNYYILNWNFVFKKHNQKKKIFYFDQVKMEDSQNYIWFFRNRTEFVIVFWKIPCFPLFHQIIFMLFHFEKLNCSHNEWNH